MHSFGFNNPGPKNTTLKDWGCAEGSPGPASVFTIAIIMISALLGMTRNQNNIRSAINH